eukprot:CAMPEP_0201998762 /NCGR_PEP_ID=MMETSP0905-20130828/5484_1 /ASSEMBLY_ACC=CAM_ASM_000554 /TAXON_ID=420261 /ORGANISM="Thalassiosira antarctica, Strain CCMP982" /LENGTH=70 /DNA_ID=CAMNT_0048554829 /DNA_START=686 /DNA_END=898 /DNA_ORIENTATION=+
MKDAPTMSFKEESALGMGQSKLAKPAVMKDAQISSSRVECVGVMGRRRGQLVKYAAMKDAPITRRKEVYV